jgi:CDP-diacylglycerol--glycerol-3-phosphate 3-phosphatidyltransferase
MPLNLANILTMIRILLIPVLVAVFYSPMAYANIITTGLFILASVTDWADGYLARRYGMSSRFGAFIDPVADKLMVASVLVLLVGHYESLWVTLGGVVIIGREITISALREWMAELGQRATVKVAFIGKLKTGMQMTALGFLLFERDLGPLPVYEIGFVLLVIAAVLTLWSMVMYLKAAWPILTDKENH